MVMTVGTPDDLVCEDRCGFRVGSNYYQIKPRFTPGVCPRCGADVITVAERRAMAAKEQK